jgi:hypothetical protein
MSKRPKSRDDREAADLGVRVAIGLGVASPSSFQKSDNLRIAHSPFYFIIAARRGDLGYLYSAAALLVRQKKPV